MTEEKAVEIPAEQQRIGTIDRIDLAVVRIPFVQPFGTSVQTWSCKEALLLRLQSGSHVGWGECVADPDPYYLPETTESARYIITRFLLPLLDPGLEMGELARQFRRIRGNQMAKATVENALLQLIALRSGEPLYRILGGTDRRIPSGLSIGLQESIGALLEEVRSAVSRKYHRIKMKIQHGKDLDWVRAVRAEFPELPLMVDANGDYSLADAGHLRRLDDFRLMMIEQPLGYADIYRHSILQKQLETAICLDESIHTLEDAAAAVDLGACRILNIKQGRVGGLLESVRMAAFAAGRKIGVWSGGMDETGIGRALNIHLQAVPGFDLPGDTSETAHYFREDIIDQPVRLDPEGFIPIPPGPGLGVEVIPERLMKYAIAWHRIR